MKAPIECTLLDLVQTFNDITDNEQEVAAAAFPSSTVAVSASVGTSPV